MAQDVKLSAATRTNLLSLQATTRLIGRTQERLSTGLKVNSALDDASAYFQARSLTNRASDLSSVKDGVDQAIQSLKAAVLGIEAATKLVEQIKGLANGAKNATTATDRSRFPRPIVRRSPTRPSSSRPSSTCWSMTPAITVST